MNTLLDSFTIVLRDVLANSAKASLLACAVALTCLMLRRWLSPCWRHVLWCTVFIRLVLPDLPVPGWNWNLSRVIPITENVRETEVAAIPMLSADFSSLPVTEPGQTVAKSEPMPVGQASMMTANSLPSVYTGQAFSIWRVLGFIWISGTFVWWAALGAGWWRFRRRVLANCTPATTQAREMLADCMTDMGMRARVELRCSARIVTPAVCGVMRHQILLPDSLESAISPDDLRLLLLHELGHVKRHDSVVQLLASMLLGLHWWNPFLWLSWHQLRHEAEAATDAWVLQRTGENSAPSYGSMLLMLASRACAAGVAMGLVPSLINATSKGRRLKQRILDIAAHQFARRWSVVPGLAVLTCLVMAGFSQEAPKDPEPKRAAEAATADSIGGIVVDESGQPIAGAEVRIEVKPSQSRFIKSLVPADYKTPGPVETDSEGRWQISGVPAGVGPYGASAGKDTFYVFVRHPQFLVQSFAGESIGDEAGFRQRTVKLALKRGLALRGVVRDESGHPIAGATIEPNLNTNSTSNRSKVGTDADGHYETKSVRSGDVTVRASASGFATQLQRLKVNADSTQDFTLKKGHTLTMKIRDDKDQPVAGASVAIFPPGDSWKAADRLLSVESPKDGVVVWEEAPEGELVVEIAGTSFARITRKVIAGVEILIKVPSENRLASVTLKVTDSTTGAPLRGCTFDTGVMYVPSSEITSWTPLAQMAVPIKPGAAEGEYTGTIPETQQKYGLKFCVRHEGYVPAVTSRVDPAKGDATLSVALQKGQPVEITVRDARDATVSGAAVYVVWQSPLQLNGFSPGPLADKQLEFMGATGADGRCVLPPCTADASVLVMHESGFASAAFADVMRSPTMKLGLYAHVEANVKKDGKPAPGVKYEFRGITNLRSGASFGFNVSQTFDAVSDSEGRILLPQVLPTAIGRFNEPTPPMPRGPGARVSSSFPNPGTGTQAVPVGQTTVFELEVKESQARTLTGRFVVQGSREPAASRNSPLLLRLNRPPTGSGIALAAAMGSADGEGRFAFDRIAPGDYTLQISSTAAKPARYAFSGGQTELKVSVPAPTVGTTDKPVDLGDVEVVDTQK